MFVQYIILMLKFKFKSKINNKSLLITTFHSYLLINCVRNPNNLITKNQNVSIRFYFLQNVILSLKIMFYYFVLVIVIPIF